MKARWPKHARSVCFYALPQFTLFCLHAQPGIQKDKLWVLWPAKPPSRLSSFNMLTNVPTFK